MASAHLHPRGRHCHLRYPKPKTIWPAILYIADPALATAPATPVARQRTASGLHRADSGPTLPAVLQLLQAAYHGLGD